MIKKFPRQIIGLVAPKQSGKSEVAKILVEDYGFTRIAFADTIKDVASIVYALSNRQLYGDAKEIIDERYGLTPRFIMQKIGSEVCRQIHLDTWLMSWQRKANDCEKVVVEDVRFDNEIEWITSRGADIWEISRPGNKFSHEHDSEIRPECSPNIIIKNDRGLTELRSTVHHIMRLKNVRS